MFVADPPELDSIVEGVHRFVRASCLPTVEDPLVDHAYRQIRQASGAVGGNAHGGAIYGEMRQNHMQMLLMLMQAYCGLGPESVFVDIGAGLGKPSIHAAITARCMSLGVEYMATRFNLSLANLRSLVQATPPGALRRMEHPLVYFICEDALRLHSFEPCTHIFLFDVGMPQFLMQHIAAAFHASRSATHLVCYRAPRDAEALGFRVKLVCSLTCQLIVSGESHRCFIYAKEADAASDDAEPDLPVATATVSTPPAAAAAAAAASSEQPLPSVSDIRRAILGPRRRLPWHHHHARSERETADHLLASQTLCEEKVEAVKVHPGVPAVFASAMETLRAGWSVYEAYIEGGLRDWKVDRSKHESGKELRVGERGLCLRERRLEQLRSMRFSAAGGSLEGEALRAHREEQWRARLAALAARRNMFMSITDLDEAHQGLTRRANRRTPVMDAMQRMHFDYLRRVLSQPTVVMTQPFHTLWFMPPHWRASEALGFEAPDAQPTNPIDDDDDDWEGIEI